MAETEMSVDSLDASLIYLKIGDKTLENIANSLINPTENQSEEGCAEFNNSGCGRRSAANTHLDLSRRSSPDHEPGDDPQQHNLNNVQPGINNNDVDENINNSKNKKKSSILDDNNNNNNNDLNKIWSASMQDLSHTVERILATGGGVGEDWRNPDLSYMGVPPSLGEMLLQHGEFPASPSFTPKPRYRSTPFETTAGNSGGSSFTGSRHNDAFAASNASSLGHHRHPVAQSMGELTYGMSGSGDRGWGPFSRSLMMTTPENTFPDDTPRLNLCQHQISPGSLPSGMSWRISDGEGPWTSLSSSNSFSSSRGSGTSLHGKHYTSPAEGNSSSLHPQYCDQSYKIVRSTTPYGRCQESSDVVPSRLLHNHTTTATTTAALHQHYHYVSSHSPRRPQTTQYMSGTGEEVVAGGGGGGGPEKVSPRKALIQNVVLRESIKAFRSHPLFPLLKDIAVADCYFDKASFNIAPLLTFLPTSTEELVSLYKRRNPEAYHNNNTTTSTTTTTHTSAIDAVIMDAIVYAHTSLLEKVTSQAAMMSASVESEVTEMDVLVEEMCQRYMGAVRSSTPLHILHALGTEFPGDDGHDKGKDGVRDPLQQLEQHLAPFSPIPPSFDTSNPSPDSATSVPEPRKRGQPHCRKVSEVLTGWLMEHEGNPYPDDDHKAALMQRTGLSAQQIGQWFINARRRHLLPKLRPDVAKE